MAPRVSIIAAIGKNRELGRDNDLLWRIPDDLKRFKSLTLGHPVIMGRKTFESIGKPLTGRTSLVVSRSSLSFENALAQAKKLDDKEIFIIGGAQIYAAAFPHADRLYLTLIDDTKDGDAVFPEYEKLFTKKLSEEIRELNGLTYRWVDLEK